VVGFVVLAVITTDEAVHTDDVGFSVVDDSAVEVTFIAHMDPGTTAECTVLALNETFNQVGVARVPVGPSEGRSTLVTARVATSEPAAGARIAGCRATADEVGCGRNFPGWYDRSSGSCYSSLIAPRGDQRRHRRC